MFGTMTESVERPMRTTMDMAVPRAERSNAGMTAAFVIVGIIVIGLLVLIILAVALPPRMWGSNGEHHQVVSGTSHQNAMPYPSPAAVVLNHVSGARSPFEATQKSKEAMAQIYAQNAPGAAIPASSSPMMKALTQQANVGIVANIMGSQVPNSTGTIELANPMYTMAAPLLTGGEYTLAPSSTGQSFEIWGNSNAFVSKPMMLGDRAKLAAQQPMMAQLAAGLYPATMQPAVPATTQTISGASAAAKSTMITDMMKKFEQQVNAPGKHGYIFVVSPSCGFCTQMFNYVKQHKQKIAEYGKNPDAEWPHVFIDISAIQNYTGPDQNALTVKGMIPQGVGVPQAYVFSYPNNVLGPIIGFMPLAQLEKEALKLLSGK